MDNKVAKKLNETKSILITFSIRNDETILPAELNRITVERKDKVKYLAMTVGIKIKWKSTWKSIMKHLKCITEFDWMLGRMSKLSIQNKFLIYNKIIKPLWRYCCITKTNMHNIQTENV